MKPPRDTGPRATRATCATPAPEDRGPLTCAFICHERQAWGDRGGAVDWARDFMRRACIAPEGTQTPFLSNVLSIESMLLHYAARGELADSGAVSERLGQEVARWAAIDRDTDRMARALVLDAARHGPPLPRALHDFAANVAAGAQYRGKQGDKGWKLQNRDRVGWAALAVLTSTEGFGLNPTRNPVAPRGCACDVLEDATKSLGERGWASLTYTKADGLWRNRARLSLEWETALMLAAGAVHCGGRLPTDDALRMLAALGATPSGRKARNQHNAPSG